MSFFSELKIPSNYKLVRDLKSLYWLKGELLKVDEFAFDIETNHPTVKSKDKIEEFLKYNTVKLAGISFAWGRKEVETPWRPYIAAYVPIIRTDDSPFWGSSQDQVLEIIKEVLETNIYKIAHNGKFDVKELFRLNGIKTRSFKFDTMLGAYLLDSEGTDYPNFGLKSKFNKDGGLIKYGVSDHFLDISASDWKKDLDDALNHYDPHFRRYSKVPLDVLYPYGCADSDLTLSLKLIIDPLLERDGVKWLFDNLLMPLSQAITLMEIHGMSVDVNKIENTQKQYRLLMDRLEPKVKDLFGKDIDIGSNQQLGEYLFEELKLPGGERNKEGWVVDVKKLKSVEHPAIKPLIEWRKAQKLVSTYCDGTMKHVRSIDDQGFGWVHPDIWLTATTGRLKTSNPNLTNQPKPDPEVPNSMGEIIRGFFVAKPGYKLVFSDYSQAELRVIAHVSRDPLWIKTFWDGKDMHSATAHAIWKLQCAVDEVKDLHPVLRKKAKAVNFGIAFGETAYGLSENIGCSYEEADKLINEDFFGVAPVLKSCIDRVHKFVMEEGYVSNIFGRRRHLKDAMLEVPHSMRWPEREVRKNCYRRTVAPYMIGYNTSNMYELAEIDISNGIYKNELKQFYKCRSCPFLKSCFINGEVGYIKRKIESAKRKSFNMIIQGSAADMTSLSLVWITQELKRHNLDAKVCLYVHDELAIYSKDEHVPAVVRIMQHCMGPRMKEFTNFAVPLVVDTEIKQNWGE